MKIWPPTVHKKPPITTEQANAYDNILERFFSALSQKAFKTGDRIINPMYLGINQLDWDMKNKYFNSIVSVANLRTFNNVM